MGTVEFRVRPVERYVVTKYTTVNDSTGSCVTLGEYPNAELASEAKAAFESAEQAKTRMSQFVIVQRGFDPVTSAYYANTLEEAESFAEQFTKLQGGEWRIYGCCSPVAS